MGRGRLVSGLGGAWERGAPHPSGGTQPWAPRGLNHIQGGLHPEAESKAVPSHLPTPQPPLLSYLWYLLWGGSVYSPLSQGSALPRPLGVLPGARPASSSLVARALQERPILPPDPK